MRDGRYIRGDEQVLRGFAPRSPFGELTAEDLLKIQGLSDPGGAAAAIQKYASIAAARKAAEEKVKQLAADSGYGPVLAGALTGASNPGALAAEAKAYAIAQLAKFPTKADQDALRFYYSQARAAFDVVDNYVSLNPTIKAIVQHVDQGTGLFGEYQNLVGKLSKGEPFDAAGIADAADLVRRTAGYVGSLITRAAGKSSTAAKVASEVTDWVSVGAGCGAAVVATGATAGAFGCAVAVLGKLFGMLNDAFSGIKLAVVDPAVQQLPMAVLTPNSKQMPQVAADAARLASLLRYRYGVASYNGFVESSFYGNKALFDSYPAAGSNKIPYGYTPQDLVFTLQKLVGTGAGDYTRAFRWGALHREASTGEKFHRQDFETWGDMDLDATYWAADIARKLGVKLNTTEKVQPHPAAYVAVEARSFKTPLVYTELVNFFSAVTLYQMQLNPAEVQPLLFGERPIKFWYCGKSTDVATSWPTDPRQEMSRYDSYIWTMMEDCAPTLFQPQHLGNAVLDSSHPGHTCALRAIGHIRLLAALSYIHMMSKWGEGTGLYPGRDMIADLTALTPSVPGYILRLPIDPRTVNGVTPTPAQLRNTMMLAVAKMETLRKAATAVSATATVSASVLAAFRAPTTTAAPIAAKTDPGVQWFTSQTNIKSTLPTTHWTQAQAPTASAGAVGGGAGGVAILGGAALLALLLLK